MSDRPLHVDEPTFLSTLHPAHQLQMARNQRRALTRMAQTLHIDASKYPPTPVGTASLWAKIKEVIGDGTLTSSANRPADISDPFGVALECVCDQDHDGRGWFRQTAIVKTGHMADQAEAESIIAFLKSEERVVTCDATLIDGTACGHTITTFSTHNGKISEMAIRDGYAMEWAQ